MIDTGLVRHGHWLYYGFEQGFGRWLPKPAQRVIVKGWNRIACSTLGHDVLIQEERDGVVECVSCGRSVRDPDVLRVWEDFDR